MRPVDRRPDTRNVDVTLSIKVDEDLAQSLAQHCQVSLEDVISEIARECECRLVDSVRWRHGVLEVRSVLSIAPTSHRKSGTGPSWT